MKFIEQLERYERMLLLMKRRACGTPKELAKRLEISESTLYEYLKALKERGAQFSYSEANQSYYLLSPFTISFGCSNLELLQTRGGNTFFSSLRKFRSQLIYTCAAFK